MIEDYDKAARYKLTYPQYQKWKVLEASISKDELKAKFIEKGCDIDKLYDEIVGQKVENHEGGVKQITLKTRGDERKVKVTTVL